MCVVQCHTAPKMENFCKRYLFIVLLSVVQYHQASSKTALLIIDVQNCFLPGGSLAVTNGDHVIPVINNIRRKYASEFELTVLSQDWHCVDHVSFASQHPGSGPFTDIDLTYDANATLCEDASCNAVYNISQTLWPDHCIMNTDGANFSTTLVREPGDVVIRKGYHCEVDSYSAFYDNGGFSHTELNGTLQKHGIDRLIVTGLALDFCVYSTSKDGKQLGYTVYTVTDASRPVSNATATTALADMRAIGVNLITSDELDAVFDVSSSPILKCSLYTILLTMSSVVLRTQ